MLESLRLILMSCDASDVEEQDQRGGEHHHHGGAPHSAIPYYNCVSCYTGIVHTAQVGLFSPTRADDQTFLSCQARNNLIDNVAVEDQWKISVHCK